MMRLNSALTSILVLLLAACTHPAHYNRQLVQADSLMQERPDSALQILEDIVSGSLKTEADRAYYALLLTQARDKNYIVQTDDSLIRTAVQYYDTYENTEMQARAYYQWGSVDRDKNKQAEAVKKYLIAAVFAENANNQTLLGRIYANAGYIYYLQNFDKKADSIYRKAEQIGILLKDTSLWISSLTKQGEIQLYQKHYPQAEKKLKQALNISKGFEQNEIKASIYSALSSLYTRTKASLKALQYAKLNFRLQKDTLHCYRTFLELGNAYYQTGQYDSATIYIRKSLSSSSYATKADSYMRLADIAKAQGNIVLSLNMERLYSAYKDSANISLQRTQIAETEQAIKLQCQQTQHEYSLKKYCYYIIIAILISIGFIYKLRKRYLKKLNRQELKARLKEEELRQQYLLSKKETVQKEEQTAALQQKIAQYHLVEDQKEKMLKELKELNEQRTLLLKETLKYSDVYTKMKKIISDYKKKGNSKESLNDEEWDRFIAEIDKNSALLKLSTEYKLDKREIRYCHLLLADFSIEERMLILQISRATLYRMEQEIFRKMNIPYQAKALQKLLKSMINDASINA